MASNNTEITIPVADPNDPYAVPAAMPSSADREPRSFTIVVDVAQTSALCGTRRWDRTMNRLFGELQWDLNELTINYRNPQEVSDLASDFAQKAGLYKIGRASCRERV